MIVTNSWRLPSVPTPAYAPVALRVSWTHSAQPAMTGPGLARERMTQSYGISGYTAGAFAGKGIAVMDAQLTGDVRGVPPRGRPV